MSFFKKLARAIKKLFGKKQDRIVSLTAEAERDLEIMGDVPRVPAEAPGTIGKFVPPETKFPEQPVNVTTEGWPVGAYEFQPGVWYVPYRGAQGGPFDTPSQAFAWMRAVDMRDVNLANADFTAPGRGSVPVTSLTDNDKAYLRSVLGNYLLVKQNGDIYRDVLSGTHEQINLAINAGDILNPGCNPWPADTVALVKAVQAAFAAASGK